MPMFSGAELTTFIEQANYVAVNDYESQMLQDKTGLDLSTIASMGGLPVHVIHQAV
jgi:adenosine kinase